ncbi:MAG: hypothetical protein E7408_00115 [Ruminococcaceae bacterium]|nr:hypothetical protein [Oscillospiraceae bacterium]
MAEKPKGFFKKTENFWYHYKIVVLIVLFFLCSALFLTADYLKKKDPDMVLAYAGASYGDESQFARAEDAFKAIIGDLNGDGKIQLNYRFMFIRGENITSSDLDKQQGFNYSFLDKNVRLYIIEDALFSEKQLYFEPLEDILPAESLAGGLKNLEGQVCAIPLADKPVAEAMDFNRPELYVAVKRIMDPERNNELVHRQHEKAKEVLKYIAEGEK